MQYISANYPRVKTCSEGAQLELSLEDVDSTPGCKRVLLFWSKSLDLFRERCNFSGS